MAEAEAVVAPGEKAAKAVVKGAAQAEMLALAFKAVR